MIKENNTKFCSPLRLTLCVHKVSNNEDKMPGNQSNISCMTRTLLKYLTLSIRNCNELNDRSTNYVIRAARVPPIRP